MRKSYLCRYCMWEKYFPFLQVVQEITGVLLFRSRSKKLTLAPKLPHMILTRPTHPPHISIKPLSAGKLKTGRKHNNLLQYSMTIKNMFSVAKQFHFCNKNLPFDYKIISIFATVPGLYMHSQNCIKKSITHTLLVNRKIWYHVQ